MSTPSKINAKLPAVPSFLRGLDCSALQPLSTLMGLSRQRLTRDDLLRLIDRREIGWAWDISRKKARRAEVRIWRESLFAFLAQEGGAAPVSLGKFTLSQVIESILPKPDAGVSARNAVLRCTDLQRRFLCCQPHITRLVRDGELSAVRLSRGDRAPAILYQSIVEFLRRRTMSL